MDRWLIFSERRQRTPLVVQNRRLHKSTDQNDADSMNRNVCLIAPDFGWVNAGDPRSPGGELSWFCLLPDVSCVVCEGMRVSPGQTAGQRGVSVLLSPGHRKGRGGNAARSPLI